MLKSCVKAVERLRKSPGKVFVFSTRSTAGGLFVVQATFFLHSLATVSAGFNAQRFCLSNRLSLAFYPLPTGLNMNTN